VGDELVYVAVEGFHRTDVFPVQREAVERYKNEVPVFKKEHIIKKSGGSPKYWVSKKEYNHP
jgi:molybdopterin synthase catalytic subunit